MLPHSTKASRTESARINGAKSTGPNTPEGMFRSQTARDKHGLYAARPFMLPGGTIERNHARLNFLARQRDQMERSLLRLQKRNVTSGPSQKSLIINGGQHPGIPETQDAQLVPGKLSDGPYIVNATDEPLPESFGTPAPNAAPQPQPAPVCSDSSINQPTIIDWAALALDFHPDEYQTEIPTEMSNRILILAPRQTGKSTAVAVRVLFEVMCHDHSVIPLAGASSRCDGFSLANVAEIVALPDNEEAIRGFSAPRMIVVDEAAFAPETVFKALEPMLLVSNGTLILLSTPNGQTELETLRKCYRDDFDLFDPEYDLEGKD